MRVAQPWCSPLAVECHRELKAQESRKPKKQMGIKFDEDLKYSRHLEKVKQAKPKVVTYHEFSATRCNDRTAINRRRRIGNNDRIMRGNLKLVQRLQNAESKVNSQPDVTVTTRKYKDLCFNDVKQQEKSQLIVVAQNLELLSRILTVEPKYKRLDLLREYEKNKRKKAELSRYPLYWKLDEDMAFCMKNHGDPKVLFEFSKEQSLIGTIEVELKLKRVPKAVDACLAFCSGILGTSYELTTLKRMIPKILIGIGPVVGKGPTAASLDASEHKKSQHDQWGTVSLMIVDGYLSSQLIVTAIPLKVLNSGNLVVGKVTSGMDIFDKLEKTGTNGVVVTHCRLLFRS